MPLPSWYDDALCAQTDPESFFPERDLHGDHGWNAVREAKGICRRCPVATECLAFALAENELFGVWGGLTAKERARMRSAEKGAA